jgi:hypothetical protein
MGRLRVTIGDLNFSGHWVEEAPRTVAIIRAMLPLTDRLVHCRWSGEGCWIPFGEAFLDLGPERATSHPAPGQMIVYPGGASECEILLAYGAVDFSSIVGQLWGNHFLTLDEGLAQLPEVGRRALWEGAQPISIEEVA